jgi:hypothetical protein
MMIYLKKHPAGAVWNWLQGAANLIDGLVRVLSLGFCFTGLPVLAARHAALAACKRAKQDRVEQEQHK